MNKQKNVLILGTGGAPGNSVVKSLKMAPEPIRIVGTDVDKFSYFRSEADKTYLTPKAFEKDSIKSILKIIKKENICFIHAQPEKEVLNISKHRKIFDKLGIKYCLPKHKTILNCQNKFLSYKIWRKRGLRVPKTILINREADLSKAFRLLGKKIWLRDIFGGGGEGALPTDNHELARIWIQNHEGWGKYTAAKLLSDQSFTWTSIWDKGKLVVAQSRKRLHWEYGSKIPSGVSGITGVGVTIDNPELNKVAQKAILQIDRSPHGIFCVDLTGGTDSKFYLTEINIGRFFTTVHFFTEAGLNMPYILLKTALGEPVLVKKRINSLPQGLYWIRGMDFTPKLIAQDEFNQVRMSK